MVNIKALDAALAAIDKDPKSWEQNSWAEKTACGTTYCLAGHIAVQSGAQIDWQHVGLDGRETATSAFVDGEWQSIRGVAQQILGVSEEQQEVLFSAYRERDELQVLRDALAGDPDADLDEALGAYWDEQHAEDVRARLQGGES